jgi:hypothetical protein
MMKVSETVWSMSLKGMRTHTALKINVVTGEETEKPQNTHDKE